MSVARLVVLFVLLASNAMAEIHGGWFVDPEGTRNWGEFQPFSTRSLYFVVWGEGASIASFEVGLSGLEDVLLLVDSELLVAGTLEPGDTPEARDFIAQLDPCIELSEPTALLRIDLFYLSIRHVDDAWLTATGVEATLPTVVTCTGESETVSGVRVQITDPPGPVCYWEWAPPYVFYFNPRSICGLPTDASSFGALKAHF